MHARTLPINIPLPDLSGQHALELAEFLYELAGRFEASYRNSIERYYRDADEHRTEQRYHTLFGTDPAPMQLELFHNLEPF
jgi:hypothetical protein